MLTQAQIQQLYKHCETARERAILSLGYGCGLRVGEMEQLNVEDIRFRDKMVIVRKGKTKKNRSDESRRNQRSGRNIFYEERSDLVGHKELAFMINSKRRKDARIYLQQAFKNDDRANE
ncbi:MAG: tyrosine-type recombinase/integrase [Saprospiraceae bacterium]|nr:tyrosine-type recombinase/integrase [Saprospiraceae bacterium]